jgi:V/A-type H+-transporting ATPase subunit E
MSLDTVAGDITEEAEERAARIREEADARAEEIVAAAEDDAAEIEAEREREIETTIEREREQQLSSAKLEAKQQRLEAHRDVLEEVREAAAARVAELSGDRREALTRALLVDAAREFEAGATVEVYGRADDADLLDAVLADYEDFERAGEIDCLGGIVAESERSRVRVNDTFDSVLDTVWDEELRAVSDRLFENGTGGASGTEIESGDGTGTETEGDTGSAADR